MIITLIAETAKDFTLIINIFEELTDETYEEINVQKLDNSTD